MLHGTNFLLAIVLPLIASGVASAFISIELHERAVAWLRISREQLQRRTCRSAPRALTYPPAIDRQVRGRH